jgi:molecular chaperone GrpE
MDGDMIDPTESRMTDEELADPQHGGRQSHAEDGRDVHDDDERASEIDDITDSLRRPPASHDELAEDELADAVSEARDEFDVDVAALVAQSDEYKDLAQRVQADFDNFRRRSQAQAQADAERATGRLAEALLPVLDAAEAAYLRHPDEVGPLLNQMLTELKKHGLEAVDLEGQPFDPEVAEAVAHEPGDGGDPVVAEVLRSGYLWKGRVLRAAMVKTKD